MKCTMNTQKKSKKEIAFPEKNVIAHEKKAQKLMKLKINFSLPIKGRWGEGSENENKSKIVYFVIKIEFNE